MASNVDLLLPPSESDSDWTVDHGAVDPQPPPPKKKKSQKKKAEKKKKDGTPMDEPDPTFDPSEHQLPRELQMDLTVDETFDLEDDLEDDDHVGFWRDEDKRVLVDALNHHRKNLKGNFEGCGGGKAKRARAWEKVAEHVNSRCMTKWNVKQTQGKASRYAKECKDKFTALRRAKQKTGGGTISDDMYLTPVEQSMLDYVGVEGVVGIPGCRGVPLKPKTAMSAAKAYEQAARASWDYKREDIPNYGADLETTRLRCTGSKKSQKKSAHSKK